MNAIGKFGNFMMNHQVTIEILMVLGLVVLAAVLLMRATLHAKKKRQLLSELNDTVSEISAAVSSLKEKKSEVIYIDNRTADKGTCEAISLTEKAPSTEQILTRAAEAAEMAETAATLDEQQAPKKYFSRDCCVSKKGKTYTIEELEEQIKE